MTPNWFPKTIDKSIAPSLYESAVTFFVLNDLDPKTICSSGRLVGEVVIDCISKAITVEQLEAEIGRVVDEGVEKHLPGKHDQQRHGRPSTDIHSELMSYSDGLEHAIITDSEGNILGRSSGEEESVNHPAAPVGATNLIAHHSHPYDAPPSQTDILNLVDREDFDSIVVHSAQHVYTVSMTDKGEQDRRATYYATRDAYDKAYTSLMDKKLANSNVDESLDRETRRINLYNEMANLALSQLVSDGLMNYSVGNTSGELKHLPGKHNQQDHAPEHLRDSAHQRYAQSMRSVESLSMAGKKGYQALIDKYGLEYAQDKTADWRREHPSALQVQVEEMLEETGVEYLREQKLAPMLYTDILIGQKAIEVDGKPWHSNKAFYGEEGRADADLLRDIKIRDAGYDVLHLTEDSLKSITAFDQLVSYLGVQKHFLDEYPQPLGPTELLTQGGRFIFWKKKRRKKLEDAIRLVKMHLPGQHDQDAHGGDDVPEELPYKHDGPVKTVTEFLHKYATTGSYVAVSELYKAAKAEKFVKDKADFVKMMSTYLSRSVYRTGRGYPIYTELPFDQKNSMGIHSGRGRPIGRIMIGRTKPAEKLKSVIEEVKHLAGKHNQKLHGSLSIYADTAVRQAVMGKAFDQLDKAMEAAGVDSKDILHVYGIGSFFTKKKTPGDIDLVIEVRKMTKGRQDYLDVPKQFYYPSDAKDWDGSGRKGSSGLDVAFFEGKGSAEHYLSQATKLGSRTKVVLKHLAGQHDQKTHGRQTVPFAFDLPVSKFDRNDTDEDWARLELRRPTDDELLEAYGMDLPDYLIEVGVKREEGYAGVIEVTAGANIVSDDGGAGPTPVMVRKFKKDWEGKTYAYHEAFELPEAHQAKGMGSDVLERSEVLYKKLGVDRIELVANAEVGRYAWARMGFDFASENDSENVLTKEHGSLSFARSFSKYLDDYKIPVDERPEVSHAWEIAAWKSGRPGIHGREYLLRFAPSYNAKKMLNDSDVGYRIGQEYYRLKKEKRRGT